MSLIRPEKDLNKILLNVSMPGRYVGGEFGSISTFNKNNLKFGISFPDLYEIGMSNQAIKLLYRGLNKLDNISCERVFAPAQDFEEQLRTNNIPLYTLENGIPLNELDILGFSIGYELSATNILTILDTGLIPIRNIDRTESDPIIIAGGPAITNPLPFSQFIDAVYIGEAEKNFYDLMIELANLKKEGCSKYGLFDRIVKSPNFWINTKTEKVKKSIWSGFNTNISGLIPVSSIATVQDNGIIEIMRGCPNSCRFCHAASFYRPYRQKDINYIIEEADFLINECGYNEITLSSLSSGDYNFLDILIKKLNSKYIKNNVSFSLPSLRINSFTLPLLTELSRVRKSGLTFAIETPDEFWQNSINKEIDPLRIIEILKEAKGMGWKLAKFYFMIGLPGADRKTEATKITSYIDEIQNKTGIKLNVNVGTFIPKAHTPFQWAPQLSEEESFHDMRYLKNYYKRNGNVKLSYHSPFVSYLEGLISRGDERVGELLIKAYKAGARLDAWEEHFNMPLWKNILDNSEWNVNKEITRERTLGEDLPWDSISFGINKSYLKREYQKALNYETSEICNDPCSHNCGVCRKDIVIEKNVKSKNITENEFKIIIDENNVENNCTYLFKFSKTGKAIYLSHLNILNVFSKSFRRSGVQLVYTQGFNPKPKIEFAHPLSLGIESSSEIFSVSLNEKIDSKVLLDKINVNLPAGLVIKRCSSLISYIQNGKKKSLMSLYGGSQYLISSIDSYKNASSFFDKMTSYNENNNYPNLSIIVSNENLEINIVNTGRKDSNIFYHIDSLIERTEFYKNYKITRTEMYTVKNRGSYFEYFYV
jgi:radical SAM family uncharacterized protein/radical SAM-linked protein